MAEKLEKNQFDEVGVNPFNAPIPGESLTTAKDMPKSWERPPQITDKEIAMENVYMEITSPENLGKLIDLIDESSNKSPIISDIDFIDSIFNPFLDVSADKVTKDTPLERCSTVIVINIRVGTHY